MGGYSEVFRCFDKIENQMYAIKIIDNAKLDDSQKLVIKNEADIMTILHHPGICKLKEMIETQS